MTHAGCAPEIFSPDSAQGIEDAICRVLDSKDLSRNLAARGIARAAEFTVDRTRGAYANLLHAVIREKSTERVKLPAIPDSQPDR
jgi:glycosyltransferase involved in cell wall biosynthesis